MDVLTDDHEREQAVRKWWSEYWKAIVLGIVVAIACLVGFRQYQAYNLRSLQEKSYQMHQLSVGLMRDPQAYFDKANAFMNDNKDIYGALLALDLASANIFNHQYDKAQNAIAFAQKYGGKVLTTQVALLNARLLAQTADSKDALAMLSTISDPVYKAQALEITGDIYIKDNQPDKAREAYKQAIDFITSQNLTVPYMLRFKFDDVTNKDDRQVVNSLINN